MAETGQNSIASATAAPKRRPPRWVAAAAGCAFLILLAVCVILLCAKRSNAYIYSAATQLLAEERYEEARLRFSEIPDYRDSADMIYECSYRAALQLKEAELYLSAIPAFEALGVYSDAAAQAEECRTLLEDRRYAAADALLAAGDYSAALQAYIALGAEGRAAAGMKECDYRLMLERIAAADPEDAIAELESWNGYSDSEARIAELKASPVLFARTFRCYEVGDVITFGSFEQDNNLENGTEPIEWLVLRKEEGSLLLISKYCLDARPYQADGKSTDWVDCDLRAWLNGDFLSTTFTEREAAILLEVTNPNPGNTYRHITGCEDTTDTVFLLSYEEARELFATNLERRTDSTPYCISRRGGNIPGDYHPTRDAWWLRTPGWTRQYAVYVHMDGHVVNYDSCQTYASVCTVRPAICISLG